MDNTHDTKATLVLGGTGKTGRRVTTRLMKRCVPVRVDSCSGVPPFDWEDRDTWTSALRDVRARGQEPGDVADHARETATTSVWGAQQ